MEGAVSRPAAYVRNSQSQSSCRDLRSYALALRPKWPVTYQVDIQKKDVGVKIQWLKYVRHDIGVAAVPLIFR